MSTGNGVARWAFAGCMLLLVACRSEDRSPQLADTPTMAWWVTVEFAPTSTTVRGVDVRSIDQSTSAASTNSGSVQRRSTPP